MAHFKDVLNKEKRKPIPKKDPVKMEAAFFEGETSILSTGKILKIHKLTNVCRRFTVDPDQEVVMRDIIQEVAGFIAADEMDKCIHYLRTKYIVADILPITTYMNYL